MVSVLRIIGAYPLDAQMSSRIVGKWLRATKPQWGFAPRERNLEESKIMSTTAMWLLLAVVVIVILFASVLYKRTFTTRSWP